MDVRFYETDAGSSPVLDYLRPLALDQRRIVGQAIRELQNKNSFAEAHVDVKTLKGKLCELRAGYHRVLYVVAEGSIIWLLLAYQKDTQKTPQGTIEVAMKRMDEVLARSKQNG